jgi:hypothetical protein
MHAIRASVRGDGDGDDGECHRRPMKILTMMTQTLELKTLKQTLQILKLKIQTLQRVLQLW